MAHYIRVHVTAIESDHLLCQLPDGTLLKWPLSEDDPQLQESSVGDELTLTLTKTQQIINELLNPTYGRE